MAGPNSKIKLVHITTAPQSLHGFFKGQVRYMISQGFEVHGVSSSGSLLEKFGEREGAFTKAINMPRAISPVHDIVSLNRLCSFLGQIKPDIVHAHTPKGGLLGMMSAFVMRVPVRIYHVHGLAYVTANGIRRVTLRLTEKISCFLAHEVFCVSQSLAEQVVKEGFSNKEKTHVLNNGSINGVDAVERFNPVLHDQGSMRDLLKIPRKALVIGFVGRVVKDKGIHELLEAWLSLKQKYNDLYLLIVGPFESKDAISDNAKQKLNSDGKVILVGRVDEPASYYAAMDVLAFPTHREGFGLAAIEASAMKVPVVSTMIPGCVDSVKDGVTGILVPSGDASALAEALAAYLENHKMRMEHGEAGRKWVLDKFKPQALWGAQYKEYCRLLKERMDKTI